MGIRLLYLGYWSINDPLTQSVIMPRIEVFSSKEEVEKIVLCTVEREGPSSSFVEIPKVKTAYFNSTASGGVAKTKFFDFIGLPKLVRALVKNEQIDLLIANSPLAGAIAWQVWKRTDTPFIVDCFEPHADYMLQSGVWGRWDLRYILLTYWERKQKQHAWRMFPVSKNYFKYLVSNGVDPLRLKLLPNIVAVEKFSFNEEDRKEIRKQLKFDEQAIVGIYVGKFGGIYYDDEAFVLFQRAFKHYGPTFRMIILTVHSQDEILKRLQALKINREYVFVSQVSHERVPKYLSASDFAFSTIKPAACRKYCSPVKDGEYWANGLPILLEEGIGDDSDIIKQEGGGVILQHGAEAHAFEFIKKMMTGDRSHIKRIAIAHRGSKILDEVISSVLADFKNRNGLPPSRLKYS